MTFLELQNRVMSRLNWTSTEYRTLVKEFLNERYRAVVTSVGLAKTRYGLVDFTITAGQNTTSSNGIAKLISLFDPEVRKRPLEEWTVAQMRDRDAGEEVTGTPEAFAILEHKNDSVTLLLWPKPDANLTFKADAIVACTDMVNDADEPTIPTDFHDVLIFGAMADCYLKIEKPTLSDRLERRYDDRLKELRFYMAKSAYLHRAAQDHFVGVPTRRTWPYGNLAS